MSSFCRHSKGDTSVLAGDMLLFYLLLVDYGMLMKRLPFSVQTIRVLKAYVFDTMETAVVLGCFLFFMHKEIPHSFEPLSFCFPSLDTIYLSSPSITPLNTPLSCVPP